MHLWYLYTWQQQQQQHHHKLGGRSASGLEELIMGCTSTEIKEVRNNFLTQNYMNFVCHNAKRKKRKRRAHNA